MRTGGQKLQVPFSFRITLPSLKKRSWSSWGEQNRSGGKWKRRRLDDLKVVSLWADGLYVRAGPEDTKAALLVMIGALTDGRKALRGGVERLYALTGCFDAPSVYCLSPCPSTLLTPLQ